MMRRYSIGMALMLAMVLALGGCKEGSDRRYDEGVSVELAQWRKAVKAAGGWAKE